MNHGLAVAFKEWAIVVEAILEGRQTLLFRQGTLGRVHQEFKEEHPQFLLYPTYEEQRSECILPNWRERFERLHARGPGGGDVILKGYATVEAIWEVQSPSRLEACAEWTIWTPGYLRQVGTEGSPVCAMLLRAFRLTEAREIAELGSYAGLRTWVDLVDEISTEGARPVLPDDTFHRQAQDFHELLGAKN